MSIVIFPFLLADSSTGIATGALGGELGGLYASKLSSISVSGMGTSAWLDHR